MCQLSSVPRVVMYRLLSRTSALLRSIPRSVQTLTRVVKLRIMLLMYIRICVCMRAASVCRCVVCVRACVRACVRVRVCVRTYVHMCIHAWAHPGSPNDTLHSTCSLVCISLSVLYTLCRCVCPHSCWCTSTAASPTLCAVSEATTCRDQGSSAESALRNS